MDIDEEFCNFKSPKKDNPHRLVRVTPPPYHVSAFAKGGIAALYRRLHDRIQAPSLPEYGEYTDDRGCFQPKPEMPLIAFRYNYIDTIGEGQSCLFIKAKDTFRGGAYVAIKVLHTTYMQLGAQEMDCIRRINLADPYGFSSTLRLHNVFMFENHYCMVFDLLHPKPLTNYFKDVSDREALYSIRLVAFKLLQVLGFLKKQNVIHADLKPENVLLKEEGDMLSLKVVDFGNAIHCVHDEVSLYYDDFELQTLLYRAPEVMFGSHFSTEIDMWSLGCILAELYMKRPIFFGRNKKEILQQTAHTLGPFPKSLFQMGKFFTQNKQFTGSTPQKDGTFALMSTMNVTHDYDFANFLAGLLRYDTKERLTPSQAVRHPFLAPVCGFRFLTEDETDTYSSIPVNRNTYKSSPAIAHEVVHKHLSSKALLKMGTKTHLISKKRMEDPGSKQVAEVVPVKRPCKSAKGDLGASCSEFDYDDTDGIPGVRMNRRLSDIIDFIREEQDKAEEDMEMRSAGRSGRVRDSPYRPRPKVQVTDLDTRCARSPENAVVDRLALLRKQQKMNRGRHKNKTRNRHHERSSPGAHSDRTENSFTFSSAGSQPHSDYVEDPRHAMHHGKRDSSDGAYKNRLVNDKRKRHQSTSDAFHEKPDEHPETFDGVEIKEEPVDPTPDVNSDLRLPSLLHSPSSKPPVKKHCFREYNKYGHQPNTKVSQDNDFSQKSNNNQESLHGARKNRQCENLNYKNSQENGHLHVKRPAFDVSKSSSSPYGTDRQTGYENEDTYEEDKYQRTRVTNRGLSDPESFDENMNRKKRFENAHNSGRDLRGHGSGNLSDSAKAGENLSGIPNKEMLIPKKGILDKLVSNLKKRTSAGDSENSQSNEDSKSENDQIQETASGIRFRRRPDIADGREKHRPRHKSVSENVHTVTNQKYSGKNERAMIGNSPGMEWYDRLPNSKQTELFPQRKSPPRRSKSPEVFSKVPNSESPSLNLLSPVNVEHKGKKRSREQMEEQNSHGSKFSKTARKELFDVLEKSSSPRRKERETLPDVNTFEVPNRARFQTKNQSLCMSSGESRISCSSVSPTNRKSYVTKKKEAIFQESFSAFDSGGEEENTGRFRPILDHGVGAGRQHQRLQSPENMTMRQKAHENIRYTNYDNSERLGSNERTFVASRGQSRSPSMGRKTPTPSPQSNMNQSDNYRSRSPTLGRKTPTPSPQRCSHQNTVNDYRDGSPSVGRKTPNPSPQRSSSQNVGNYRNRSPSLGRKTPTPSPQRNQPQENYEYGNSQPLDRSRPRHAVSVRREQGTQPLDRSRHGETVRREQGTQPQDRSQPREAVRGEQGTQPPDRSRHGEAVRREQEKQPPDRSRHGEVLRREQGTQPPDRSRPREAVRREQGTQRNKMLSPVGNEMYKFDTDSENDSEHSRSRTLQVKNRNPMNDVSPGRRQDVSSDHNSDNHSGVRSKAFHVSPKKPQRSNSRAPSPSEEWHSPRHFNPPQNKRVAPIYSVGHKPMAHNTQTNIRKDAVRKDAFMTNTQPKPPRPDQIKHKSGSFLDSPVSSDDDSAFVNGRKPMVETSVQRPLPKDLRTSAGLNTENTWPAPSLGQRGIGLQTQKYPEKKIESKIPELESWQRLYNGHSFQQRGRGSSAESIGRKPSPAAPGPRQPLTHQNGPVPGTSREGTWSSQGTRGRGARRASRSAPVSDSSPSPSPGRTRSDTRSSGPNAMSATGRPQRKCCSKKKVTFDQLDGMVSGDDRLDPNYDACDDGSEEEDFSPSAKKKRATQRRTPKKGAQSQHNSSYEYDDEWIYPISKKTEQLERGYRPNGNSVDDINDSCVLLDL